MAYQPAVNITTLAGLNHVSGITYWNKVGLDRLEKNFRHGYLGEGDVIPLRAGLTYQWFRYSNLAANTTAATEGTVGTSVSLQSNTVSATVSQYVDFCNISDLLKDTAIDPIVENAVGLMAYRLGLSVDTIVRTELESVNSSVDGGTVGSYFSGADLNKIRSLLQAADVQPFDNGYFRAICSPYVTYDLLNDPTTTGFTELHKWMEPSRVKTMQDRGLVGRLWGCELWESTNVATSGASPNTAYHVTIVGKGALGIVDLAGRGISGFKNNSGTSGMPIKVLMFGPDKADPAGVIGAACSYNVVFVAKLLRTGSEDYRFRIVEADSSITT